MQKINIFLPIEKRLDKNSSFENGQASAKNLKDMMDPYQKDSKIKPVWNKRIFTNFVKTQGFRGALVKMRATRNQSLDNVRS